MPDAAQANRKTHKDHVRKFLEERGLKLTPATLAEYYRWRMPWYPFQRGSAERMARQEIKAWWQGE